MDLGNISGRILDLPEKTEVYVVDFLNKKLVLHATVDNRTFDPQVTQRIQSALDMIKSIKPKRTSKKTKQTA